MSHMLFNVITGLTLINLFAELLICPHNVDELMREIIVHSLIIVHHHGGTNGQRRNSKFCTDHPSGMRILRAKSKNLDGFIGHPFKASKYHLRLNGNRLFLSSQKTTLKSANSACDLFYLFEDSRTTNTARNLSTFRRFTSFRFEINRT